MGREVHCLHCVLNVHTWCFLASDDAELPFRLRIRLVPLAACSDCHSTLRGVMALPSVASIASSALVAPSCWCSGRCLDYMSCLRCSVASLMALFDMNDCFFSAHLLSTIAQPWLTPSPLGLGDTPLVSPLDVIGSIMALLILRFTSCLTSSHFRWHVQLFDVLSFQ